MMLFVALVLPILLQAVIYNFQDISLPIRYIDNKSGYFLALDDSRYIYGAAYGHGKGDVTQKAGPIVNCTEGRTNCKRLGEFVLVSSKVSGINVLRKSGQRILIRRMSRGGLEGSVFCYSFDENGCVTRHTKNTPVMRYSYSVSSKGLLEKLCVEWLNEVGAESKQELVSSTEKRLAL